MEERKIDNGKRKPSDLQEAESQELTDIELGRLVKDALFTHARKYRGQPRMALCLVSRDHGKTWTEESIDRAVTDPEISVLKVGDLVKEPEGEFTYVIVANEGENKLEGPFINDPNTPFYLPEGHLYWNALPYTE